MEHGGAKHHRQRVSEALRDEISTLIEGELADPRIGLATVSEVQISPDGRTARVFVAVLGDDKEAERTMEGLNAARQYMRREVAERLGLRQAPELLFQIDRSEQIGARVEELLGRLNKRQKK